MTIAISQELLYLYGFVLEDNPDDYLMVRMRGTSMAAIWILQIGLQSLIYFLFKL